MPSLRCVLRGQHVNNEVRKEFPEKWLPNPCRIWSETTLQVPFQTFPHLGASSWCFRSAHEVDLDENFERLVDLY